MRKPILLVLATIMVHGAWCQSPVDLEEDRPVRVNGLEYGYFVTNERSKEVKGEDYDRYEINLYVTNNSGCIKIFPFRSGFSGKSADDEVAVAEFNCKNATGKRLTAKTGKVNAKAWYAQVKLYDENASSKYKLVNAQAGFALRDGETVNTKIIVIVPRNERPRMNCRAIYIPEL